MQILAPFVVPLRMWVHLRKYKDKKDVFIMMKKAMVLCCAVCCTLMLLVPALAAKSEATPIPVHGEFWSSRLYVDGEIVGLWDGEGYSRNSIEYNGTVYIPLRTACMWIGAGVEWQEATRTISVTKNKLPPAILGLYAPSFEKPYTEEMRKQHSIDLESGFTAQLRPDFTVTVDGVPQQFKNVLGETVYPLTYLDCTYLPVRTVGELCGKQVLWLPMWSDEGYDSSHIYLYDRPTKGQIAETKEYCVRAQTYADQFKMTLDSFAEVDNLTKTTFCSYMEQLKKNAEKMAVLPTPSAKAFYPATRGIRQWASELVEGTNWYCSSDALSQFGEKDTIWNTYRDRYVLSVLKKGGEYISLSDNLHYAQLQFYAVTTNG